MMIFLEDGGRGLPQNNMVLEETFLFLLIIIISFTTTLRLCER